MKTRTIVLLVVAAAAVFFILMIAACGGFMYWGFKSTDAQVSPRVEHLFAAIDSGTFADTYDTDTAPELRAAATKEQYAQIGETIATRLGHLKSKTIENFKMNYTNGESFMDATYRAVFDKGDGVINVRLKNVNGKLLFVNFTVNSPVLNQPSPTAVEAVPAETKEP